MELYATGKPSSREKMTLGSVSSFGAAAKGHSLQSSTPSMHPRFQHALPRQPAVPQRKMGKGLFQVFDTTKTASLLAEIRDKPRGLRYL